ncbi:hypothetical protein EXIGLDRAFT_755556, partial [Exidia glandulosa HHB12029]
MPVISFSSVGDIIAISQVAAEVVKNLRNASTTCAEVRDLATDVDSLQSALKCAESLIESVHDIPQSVYNAVAHALRHCESILRHLAKTIETHRKAVVKAYGRNIWTAFWAACAWSILGGKVEAEALRRRLSEQVSVIHVLLSVLQSQRYHEVALLVQHTGGTRRIAAFREELPVTVRYRSP